MSQQVLIAVQCVLAAMAAYYALGAMTPIARLIQSLLCLAAAAVLAQADQVFAATLWLLIAMLNAICHVLQRELDAIGRQVNVDADD